MRLKKRQSQGNDMLQFRIQSTPNPNARKYIVNRELKAEGKVSYRLISECEHVPMAEAILSVPGVNQVHFFENCLTVTQDGSMNWGRLDHAVQTLIAEHIESHDVHFVDHPNKPSALRRENMSPTLQMIDDILEKTVRPGLQMDGGDIEPIDLDNHILTVRYLGACGGCPSSMTATLDAVTQILRDEFDENLEVVAI